MVHIQSLVGFVGRGRVGTVLRGGLALALLLSFGLVPAGVPKAEALGAGWTQQMNGNANWTTENLLGVSATGSVAFAVGMAGDILSTSTGGTTWGSTHINGGPALRAVSVAPGTTTAWAVGQIGNNNAIDGAVWKTTDGIGWIQQSLGSNTTGQLNGVVAIDANTALAVGDLGSIIKTTNGGATWVPQQNSGVNWTTQNLRGAAAAGGLLWAVGGNVVLVSSNGGTTWGGEGFIGTPGLTAIAVAPGIPTVWVVGAAGAVWKASNANGAGFLPQGVTAAGSHNLNGVLAVDANTAVAVGDGGTVIRTVNGTLWTADTTPFANPGPDLLATTTAGGVAWAVGAAGNIIVTGGSSQQLSYTLTTFTSQVCVVIDAPTPANINYGPVVLGGTAVSPQITARNCGNAAEDLTLQGAIAFHTVAGDTDWTLAAAPAADVYAHGFGNTNNGTFTPLTMSATSLIVNLANAGTNTKNFFTQLRTPTSTTGNGARTTGITVVATAN